MIVKCLSLLQHPLADHKVLLAELKCFSEALSQSEAPLTRKGSDDARFWHITDVRTHMNHEHLYTSYFYMLMGSSKHKHTNACADMLMFMLT